MRTLSPSLAWMHGGLCALKDCDRRAYRLYFGILAKYSLFTVTVLSILSETTIPSKNCPLTDMDPVNGQFGSSQTFVGVGTKPSSLGVFLIFFFGIIDTFAYYFYSPIRFRAY